MGGLASPLGLHFSVLKPQSSAPYAPVGTVGVPVYSSSGTVAPAWGTGETRAAGNLLVLWCAAFGVSPTIPATPSGWTLLVSRTANFSATAVFFKIASGGDAAPTLSGAFRYWAQLGEFTTGPGSPIDQTASATGVGNVSPGVATAAGNDATVGELLLGSFSMYNNLGAHVPITGAFNNATHTPADNSSYTNVGADNALFGYGVGTSNASPDSATWTWTANPNFLGWCGVLVSAKHP